MQTLYQMLNCLPGPHGRQRHLKVGRGRQKYVFCMMEAFISGVGQE